MRDHLDGSTLRSRRHLLYGTYHCGYATFMWESARRKSRLIASCWRTETSSTRQIVNNSNSQTHPYGGHRIWFEVRALSRRMFAGLLLGFEQKINLLGFTVTHGRSAGIYWSGITLWLLGGRVPNHGRQAFTLRMNFWGKPQNMFREKIIRFAFFCAERVISITFNI